MHLPSQPILPVMDSLFLPSDTAFTVDYMNFWILLKFECSTEFIWDICDHFVAAILLCKALFIETVKVMREEERKKCIWGEMEMYISTVKWMHTQCKQVCVCVSWCFMLHTQRGSSSALCCITAPFPLSPTALGRVPEGEIIHCRVCQRQGGGLSMGPPSLPCLGLPLLPARPISSAWHSRDSCTEPEANLSSPHSPDKMISLSVLSTLSPRVLMRWNGCQ